MRSGTDTGSMQKEATSAIELVGKKKSDTESDVTERKRKPDTSPLAGLFFSSDPLWSGGGEGQGTGVSLRDENIFNSQ